jgi:hypothetical protein
MKKDNNTVEKHYAVTTMLAQHTATLKLPGNFNTAVEGKPGHGYPSRYYFKK